MDDLKVNQNPKLGSIDRPNSYIGRSVPRQNAKKHLDGGGQFVDDLTLPRNGPCCLFKITFLLMQK